MLPLLEDELELWEESDINEWFGLEFLTMLRDIKEDVELEDDEKVAYIAYYTAHLVIARLDTDLELNEEDKTFLQSAHEVVEEIEELMEEDEVK